MELKRFTEEEIIEEMVSFTEKKYGRMFVNVDISYPDSTWDRPVLYMYPKDGHAQEDVFAVQRLLRKGEFFLQDTYHGIYYKNVILQDAKEEIHKYIKDCVVCTHTNCEFKDDIDYTQDVFTIASKGALIPDIRIYVKQGLYDGQSIKKIADQLVQVFSDKYYGGILSIYTLSDVLWDKISDFQFEERLPSYYNKEYKEREDVSISKMWMNKEILIEE